MFGDKLKQLISKKTDNKEKDNNKKIENLVFFIVLLIITIVIINIITKTTKFSIFLLFLFSLFCETKYFILSVNIYIPPFTFNLLLYQF